MRYVEIDGLRLSRIGLGTWQFGSREWGYGADYAETTAPALLHRAIELGITMVDTAEAYGPGTSERIIGRALADVDPGTRAGLVVATKFLPIAPAEPIVARQIRGSLARLRAESLDLLYVHWKNPFVSARRVAQAVRPLVQEGLVRRVGVSNFTLAQWIDAEAALRAPVIANQVRFNLLTPGPAEDLVPHAAAMGRVVVAYSPLAQGSLSVGNESAKSGRRRLGSMAQGSARSVSPALQAALVEIAGAHDATPAQVALAWVIGHPNTIAIPGARTVEQLEQNAAAADLELAADEMEQLSLLASLSVAGR
jgi:aryl-alcohol dehydrogenase-like predicted oxidoreductase